MKKKINFFSFLMSGFIPLWGGGVYWGSKGQTRDCANGSLFEIICLGIWKICFSVIPCTVSFNSFNSNLRIIWEENEHLICRIIIVSNKDDQITSGGSSLTWLVTKLLLDREVFIMKISVTT